jgi:hypothetical protein
MPLFVHAFHDGIMVGFSHEAGGIGKLRLKKISFRVVPASGF